MTLQKKNLFFLRVHLIFIFASYNESVKRDTGGKSYEKDLKCLFFRTILSIEGICDESVMELGRNC